MLLQQNAFVIIFVNIAKWLSLQIIIIITILLYYINIISKTLLTWNCRAYTDI